MNNISGITASPSYFWSCITLTDDCSFFSNVDPNIFYYAVGLICFYSTFMLVILADLGFYWSIDKFMSQLDNYINLVKSKVRRVQMDQRRLMSTQERTEKQLKRSKQCQRIINALRGALAADNCQQLPISIPSETVVIRRATYSECHSIVDF